MPSLRSVPITDAIEKNRIASGNPFIQLLDITVVDPSNGSTVDQIFIAHNNENLTYKNEVYQAMPFNLGVQQETGSIPEVNLSIPDYKLSISTYIRDYEGIVGSKVKLMVVNSANLEAEAELVEYFEVIGAKITDFVVNIKLGAESTLAKNFPARRMNRDRCAWRYKSTECGYSGPMPTCDLSLQGPNGCAAHGNTLNFGAFPAIRSES